MITRFGLATLATCALLGTASAADKVEWNHSTWGNPRAFTKGFETVADHVAQKSGGNFTIKIHYGEAISPVKQNLDGIKIGAFEQTSFCTSYHPGKNPAGTVLDLPFLPLKNWDVLKHTHMAFNDSKYWADEMKRWGARPFFSAILPQYEFLGVGEPPKTLEAWKGMRVRALGGLGEAMRTLGAVPTTMPSSETYTAMERGITQAVSLPFTYAFAAYKLQDIARWYTSGMEPGTVFCPIVNNLQAYERLPEEYKAMLDEALPMAFEALKGAYAEADAKNLPDFEARLTKIEYTPAMVEEFRVNAAKPVWDKWVEDNKSKIPAQEILDFVLNEATKAGS